MTTLKMPEPVGFMWQHDETGRIGFVDAGQPMDKWTASNPRLNIISTVYTAEALRDVLEQAAQVCESDYRVLVARRAHADSTAIGGANFAYFNEVMGRLTACATEIRAMKEQIK